MTAYQKRIKERDEALKEVRRLKGLIHGVVTDKPDYEELLSVSINHDIEVSLEKFLWQGESKKGER